MHNSKVGVVAFSLFVDCACFGFWEDLPLDWIFNSYGYFVLHYLHTYGVGSKLKNDDQ